MTHHPQPTLEGHYWAKLIAPVNMPDGEDWVSGDWEVVQVWDNNDEGDNAFRASVCGVSPSQPLCAFEWGPRVSEYVEAVVTGRLVDGSGYYLERLAEASSHE